MRRSHGQGPAHLGRSMCTTIGVPFFGNSAMLGECLRSLEKQTVDDFRVLVIGDGQEPDSRDIPNDSRFEVYTLPKNRGSYFARAVSLEATTTENHAVIDADDWVEPHWLETMLQGRLEETGAVQHGVRIVEKLKSEPEVVVWKHARRPLATRLLHYTSHTGLYKTERLREAGGYSPAFRVSYDSLLVSILRLQGPVDIVDEPLYHRRIHADSLTMAPATRIGSAHREPIKRKLGAAYRKMYRLRNRPAQLRSVINSLTPSELWDEVRTHAQKVNDA